MPYNSTARVKMTQILVWKKKETKNGNKIKIKNKNSSKIFWFSHILEQNFNISKPSI